MRRRIYRILNLMIVYAFLYSIPCNAQSADISVYLDGIQFEAEFGADVLNDRLLFSVRDTGRLINYEVTWQEELKTAVLSSEKKKISFKLNKKSVIEKDGEKTTVMTMDVAPVIINERMYIPVRATAKISGLNVSWDPILKRVDLLHKETSENKPSFTDIVPEIPIHYSPESEKIDEITAYIKAYIDEDFNVDDFEVKTNVSSGIVAGEVESTSISLRLKKGGFTTNDGYDFLVENGFVDHILIKGNPIGVETESEIVNNLPDEEWLKKKALESINIVTDGYKVERQRILKKYDYEPYYAVVTEIGNGTFSYSEYFEYRMNQ